MHLYVILTKCISSMPFYSTKMYLSTSSTASVYVFFYAILFYEDLFLNFPNRQFIYSMLFYFTKIYFQLASSGFLLCHIYKDISQLSQPAMYFFYVILFTKAYSGLPCWTNRDLPHLTGLAMLPVQQVYASSGTTGCGRLVN